MTTTDNQSSGSLVEPLTRRESEILVFLSEGFSAPEIAEQLSVAISSVKFHIQNLYSKLGVTSKRQALVRAAELGLLAAPPVSALLHPAPAATPVEAARQRRVPEARRSPAPRHNLPVQLTNFIGRAPQIAEVKRLMGSTRLLTLTGPGGSGKTRLALQIAAESLGDFADGAWLVELAPVAEAAQVPQAVAQSLALSTETVQPFEPAQLDRSGREALSLIVDHLRHKHLLLILDNCEHLVAACAQLAEHLLRAAPGLRVLATSREALGVIGETSYPVPALSVPDPQQLPALEVIAQSEAIQLFVERARAVRLDFALTKPNAPAVAQICQRLDGIPLAIELAAARVRALTVEQIAARLDNRFALLTGGSRSAPPRQQTLRATIDWSYELLTEGERALLRRLSVFAGGWTLEAAEQVMGEPQALDWLAQLVVKSLAQSTQPPGEEARFSMLETIRQYAQEKLAADGESKLAHRRHLAYCLALAEAAASELRGRGQSDWLNRLDRENDNLRAALGWAIQQDEAESALRLAGALTYFWIIRWNLEEGRRWLAAALHLPARPGAPGPSAWQARALLGAGWLALENDPSPSRPWAERALAVYRELGDKAGMAFALWLQAGQRRSARDYAGANQQYAEALDLWQKAEDSWGAGFCLLQMGQAAGDMGNSAKAQECYQRSVEIWREVGDRWQLLSALGDLAFRVWMDGDGARARAILEESLTAFDELEDNRWILLLNHLTYISIILGDYARAGVTARSFNYVYGGQRSNAIGRVYLGQIDLLQGRLPEAQAHLAGALQSFRDINQPGWSQWVGPWLAAVAYRQGDLQRAKALINDNALIYCNSNMNDIDDPDREDEDRRFPLLVLGDIARVQGEPAMAAGYYTRSLKILLHLSNQPEVPDRLEGFAKLAAAGGQSMRAARLFGAAAALRERMGIPIPPVERADYDGALALIRSQLNPAAFDAAWAEGLAMNWEQAAAYALETQMETQKD